MVYFTIGQSLLQQFDKNHPKNRLQQLQWLPVSLRKRERERERKGGRERGKCHCTYK